MFVHGKEGVDPSSVVVDALVQAREQEADVVIVDTAGRLHTKVDLMEELQKVGRTIAKRIPGAPQEAGVMGRQLADKCFFIPALMVF